MKKFFKIDGYIIAVDAIAMIHPPDKDGKTFVLFAGGDKGHVFPEEWVAKLRALISEDCTNL